MRVHKTPMTFTENSSVVTNDTQGPWKYPNHNKVLWGYTSMCDMALKLSQYFHLLKSLLAAASKFSLLTITCQAAQGNQKTPIAVSLK